MSAPVSLPIHPAVTPTFDAACTAVNAAAAPGLHTASVADAPTTSALGDDEICEIVGAAPDARAADRALAGGGTVDGSCSGAKECEEDDAMYKQRLELEVLTLHQALNVSREMGRASAQETHDLKESSQSEIKSLTSSRESWDCLILQKDQAELEARKANAECSLLGSQLKNSLATLERLRRSSDKFLEEQSRKGPRYEPTAAATGDIAVDLDTKITATLYQLPSKQANSTNLGKLLDKAFSLVGRRYGRISEVPSTTTAMLTEHMKRSKGTRAGTGFTDAGQATKALLDKRLAFLPPQDGSNIVAPMAAGLRQSNSENGRLTAQLHDEQARTAKLKDDADSLQRRQTRFESNARRDRRDIERLSKDNDHLREAAETNRRAAVFMDPPSMS
jgi:hypothetical protein